MHRNSFWSAAALLALATALPLHAQSAADADSPEAAKIRRIETNWAQALVKKDQYALDLALAPNYVDISATGDVTTKNQQIARLFAADYPVLSYDETLTSIRVLGETALAQGTYTLRHTTGAGHAEEERGIFTHVYQRARDTWQCVNAQRTVVREQPAPLRTAEKKSEMPFHVPFTGHKKNEPAESSVTVAQPAPAPAATPGASQQTQPATTPAPQAAPKLENVQ
jgi:ketosteroid isomerase-like protein